MNEYPEYIVRAILIHWQEIESLKMKITPTLIAGMNIVPGDAEDYFMQEGNTLQYQGPRGTRVPHNSNARVEALCVMTADIDQARKTVLDPFEDVAMMALFSLPDENISLFLRENGEAAFAKIVAYLND